MSICVMAYAVDLELLAVVCKNQTQELRDKLQVWLGSRLQDLDDQMMLTGGSSAVVALDALLAGKSGAELDRDRGNVYAYVYEALCAQYGQRLNNTAFCPTSTDFFDRVDSWLAEHGVRAISMQAFTNMKLPVRLPLPEDFPLYGYIKRDELLVAQREFETLSENAVDGDTADAVRTLREWVAYAVRESYGIIAFCY